MIVRQGQPQLFFQLRQLLAEGVGLSGQALIVLTQGEIFPLHKAGIDGGAGRQRLQSGHDALSITEHDLGRQTPPGPACGV